MNQKPLESMIVSHWITMEEMNRLNRLNEDKKMQTETMLKALKKWGHLIEDGQLFRLCYLGEKALVTFRKSKEDMSIINFLYYNSHFLCPFAKFNGKFRQI